MKVPIHSPEQLGLALRAVRRDSHVTLEALAQQVGVSKQTATSVERGNAKLSTLFDFLREVGIQVTVEIPESALAVMQHLEHQAHLKKLLPPGTEG